MKRKAAPSSDLADWCAVLSAANLKADVVPPEWLTVLQIAEKTGKSRSHTSHQVQAAYNAGALERRVFNVPTGDKVYPVPHYKPASK